MIDPRHDINCDYVKSGAVYRLEKSDVSPQSLMSANNIFCRYLSVVRATRLVDKYPELIFREVLGVLSVFSELIFRVDYLLELFPDAKIIFITRNGIDACRSIDLWSRRLGTSKGTDIEDWWGRNDCKWKYIVAQIINEDPEYEVVKSVANTDLDHLNRAAIEWIVTMREGFRQFNKYQDSIVKIRYEDITTYPDQEIAKLLTFCELSDDKCVYDYAVVSMYENQQKSYPKLLPEIDSMFRSTMILLGYKV